MSEEAKTDAPKDAPKQDAPAKEAAKPDEAKPTTRVGRIGAFIAKHHTVLSSTVLGVAGLIATSIWQYRQGEISRRQAESQQKVAETQAENSWKIERAEILGKNLQVLAASGPGTADQKYGVLLSLTRANIIDPELTISYALELGKDNPEYMKSVLANAGEKDYARLEHAYTLSCEDRFGTSPDVDLCTNDKLAPRSQAIAELIADDVAATLGTDTPGPMALLKDEHQVQRELAQMTGVFEEAITNMYEQRQWDDLAKFEASSPGAHLVASLAVAAARTGELVTDDESRQLEQFHQDQTHWLVQYLAGKACDAECKGRMVDVMVSHYEEAQGDYDAAMRQLFDSPAAQSARAISRLHARLLWCQVDDTDLAPLRDHALVPAAAKLLATPNADPVTRDGVISLLAVVPDPPATDAAATAAWSTLMAQIDKAGGRASRMLKDRRAAVATQRKSPPAAIKRLDFCAARPAAPGTDATDASVPADPTGGLNPFSQ